MGPKCQRNKHAQTMAEFLDGYVKISVRINPINAYTHPSLNDWDSRMSGGFVQVISTSSLAKLA